MSRGNFQFVGEALAFDFVNTEIIARRKPVDLLDTPDDLVAWWDAVLERYPANSPIHLQTAQAAFGKAKALRGALRRIFTAVVEHEELSPGDLDILNDVLSTGHTRLVVTPEQRFSIRQTGDEEHLMLLAIAHSAAWLLTECEHERLHKCKNGHCVLMFLDTTKNGNRVWCSIDCMNRARSAEHYQHQKENPA